MPMLSKLITKLYYAIKKESDSIYMLDSIKNTDIYIFAFKNQSSIKQMISFNEGSIV